MDICHDYLTHYKPKQDDIWLDLGACIGSFLKDNIDMIIKYNIHVWCVEPNPNAFIILQEWCNKNLPINTTLLNVGVWKEETKLEFNSLKILEESSFTIHMQDCIIKNSINNTKLLLQVISLDNIIDLIGKDINFIKSDIEGSELEVFHNCTQLDKIKNICIASYHRYSGCTYSKYLKNIKDLIKRCDRNLLLQFINSTIGQDSIETATYLYLFFESKGFKVKKEHNPWTLLYCENGNIL